MDKPEQEAGEDHAVDVAGPPGIGPDHQMRAEMAGPGHRELDPPELAQQPAAVGAVAALGRPARGHLLQVPIHAQGHLPLQDLGQRGPPGGAVILAPVAVLPLHLLDHGTGLGQAPDRHGPWHRGTPSQGLSLTLEYPFPRP